VSFLEEGADDLCSGFSLVSNGIYLRARLLSGRGTFWLCFWYYVALM